MIKTVFLDRDGVINRYIDLLHKKEDVELLPRVGEAIKLLNDKGYLVVIVTNQPVVAKGLCTFDEAVAINNHIQDLLNQQGARIDAVYICPHHPNPTGKIGDTGPNMEYVRGCDCRKPKPGMILQAMKELGVETPSLCYMTGDSISDIKAGNEAGCKTILLDRERAEKFNDAIPNHKARDLYEAVTGIILKGEGD